MGFLASCGLKERNSYGLPYRPWKLQISKINDMAKSIDFLLLLLLMLLLFANDKCTNHSEKETGILSQYNPTAPVQHGTLFSLPNY
jgi:hypothetical protein